MMKVALDLRACQFSNYATRGIGYYSKNLVNNILKYDRHNEYVIFGYKGIGDFLGYKKEKNISEIELFGYLPLGLNQRMFIQRKGIESTYFNYWLKRRKIDLVLSFLSGDGQVKLEVGRVCKLVRIFYDLIPLLFGNHYFLDEKSKIEYLYNLKEFENSDSIITISNNSKNDLLKYIDFKPDKIKVIYPGVSETNFSEDNFSAKKLAEYGIKNKYLLYVGGYDYRKNVESIIKAFARQENDIKNNFQLVFAGDAGQPQKDKLKALAQKHDLGNKVIFTGFVPDQDIIHLYRNAVALVYPSLYEGFGMTVLEAMTNHCAVITSKSSSLGEIAKNYALTFDPTKVSKISQTMYQIITDNDLRNDLRKRAFDYAKNYNWKITAIETIKFLQQSI